MTARLICSSCGKPMDEAAVCPDCHTLVHPDCIEMFGICERCTVRHYGPKRRPKWRVTGVKER